MINLTPEQTDILKSQGVTKEQMQSDIDKFRKQGMSDDEIQKSLNEKLQTLSEPQPQDISEETGTPTYALNAEKNNYIPEGTQKNKWWHPLLNALPVAGTVIGGLAGEGIASVPLAAGGAMAGEQLKQLIEALSGQRRRMDAKEALLNAPLGGAAAEIGGKVIGKGFEAIQPKIAQSLAKIPKEDYLRVLAKIKNGEPIFQKGALKNTSEQIGNIVKSSNAEIPYNDLTNQIDELIKSYEGGGINPAKEEANPTIKKLSKWLEESRMSNASPETEEMLSALEEKGIPREQALQFGSLKIPQNIPFAGIHEAKMGLKPDYARNPVTGETLYKGKGNELVKNLYTLLNKAAQKAEPEYEAANKAYQTAKSEEMFDASSPTYLKHMASRNLARMAAFGANPAHMATEIGFFAQASPWVQKQLLKAYSTGSKTHIIPALIQALSGASSQENKQYNQALKQQASPDGSIPAQQYRNRR